MRTYITLVLRLVYSIRPKHDSHRILETLIYSLQIYVKYKSMVGDYYYSLIENALMRNEKSLMRNFKLLF